jgi:CRISPR/Cas system-associated exonuclease Cas4 (RecB family)
MLMKTKSHTIYKTSDGTRVVGVTTVVNILAKPALIEWANRIGLAGIEVGRYVDDKADIGTLAHDMVVCHLKNEKVNTDDYSKNQIEQAEWACLSFFEWLKSHKIELIWAEKPLVHEALQYGGTGDIYATVDSKKELIDLKTGSGIYDEHKIQTCGGYVPLLESNGFPVDKVRILNIPRTQNENWGEVILYPDQFKKYQDMFFACKKIYDLRKQLKGEVTYAKKHEKDLFDKKGN